MSGLNHPMLVWSACFLGLISMFAITWSLLLFICVNDILVITGTDLVNAFVLLLGLVMLPVNVHMFYAIAKGQKINRQSKVLCCPLWLCILWIIIINCMGIALCTQRINTCEQDATQSLSQSMTKYRNTPKHKRFVDNLQWSLKCCGLTSYEDWFKQDWYDNIREYEWDPSRTLKREVRSKNYVADSVPLSCCKTGSCVSNFLMELGTHSINTNGCSESMHRIIRISMGVHLVVFVFIIIAEAIVLKHIACKDEDDCAPGQKKNLMNVMSVNTKFDSNASSWGNPDDSDDFDLEAIQE